MTIYRVWETSKERSEGMASEAFYERRMGQIIDREIGNLLPPLPDSLNVEVAGFQEGQASPHSRPNSLPNQNNYGQRPTR